MKSSSAQNAREAEGWGAFSSLTENRKSGVGIRGGGSHVHCAVAFFLFRKEPSDCRNEGFSPGSRNKTRHAQNLRFSQCLCTASQKACSSQWFLHSFETVDALQNLQNSKARHLGKYTVGSFRKRYRLVMDGEPFHVNILPEVFSPSVSLPAFPLPEVSPSKI